jgi:hypothetical protein
VDQSLGVDLGTTFVKAAIATAAGVEMLTLGDHSTAVPAAVYLREDGTLVTGEAANSRAVRSPDRVSREFKRLLGKSIPVSLGGQAHSVTALFGALLRDILHKVFESQGQLPDCVALTHPASWGPFHRTLFDEVPGYAGLHHTAMATEPEAAVIHYASSRLLTDGETVAVYDLGGATFEATVVRKIPGGTEVLGDPQRMEKLGGVDFDEAILSYIDYATDGAVSELDIRDSQSYPALARLRQNCILAKEALSVDAETVFPVFLPSRHLEVRLTRSQFENMVKTHIESTIDALFRALGSAGVKPTDLSAVLLVGGSSRIPLVAKMLSAELGRSTVVDTHPEYAVALGAALFATLAPMQPRDIVPCAGQRPNRPPSPKSPPPTRTPPDVSQHDKVVLGGSQATQTAPRALMEPAVGTGQQQRNAQPLRPAESRTYAVTPRVTPRKATLPNPAGSSRDRIPLPRVPVSQTDQGSVPPQTSPGVSPPATDSRQRHYWLLLATATALVIVIAATAFLAFLLLESPNPNTPASEAQLVLSTSKVALGDTYSVTASGFSPGENVKISWTGPTEGVMGIFPTAPNGNASNQIFERDPPGNYTFRVIGLTSGRTASTTLQVHTGTGTGTGPNSARLMLSKPEVPIGEAYYATAWGFLPGEEVRFSWTGPTNGVMGTSPTDSDGTKSHGPVLEKDPPGNYVIIVTGLTSGRTASAELKVLQPGG